MPKPFIPLLIALLLSQSGYTQYRWDKLYNFCPDTIFSGYPFNTYADSTRVFVSGGTFDPSIPKVIPFIAALDYTGQMLWKKYIYNDGVYDGYLGNGNGHSSLKPYAERRYIAALTNERDSIHAVATLFQPYLFFFNEHGDSIRKVYMEDSFRSKYFHSLIVDTQKNIVALGWTSSKGYHPVGSFHGWDSNAVLVVKMDTLGNVLWEKKYQETFLAKNTPYIDVLSIDLSADRQHYILFCTAPNAATGLVQNIVIKIDLNGNEIWKKWLPLQYQSSVDGQLISLRSGGYIFCSGYAKSPPQGAPVGNELYYGKLDEQGNLLWSKTYTSFVGHTEGLRVVERQNGDLLFLGRTYYNADYPFLLLTDADGIVKWCRTYKRTGGMFVDESLFTLHELPDKRILMTGQVLSYAKQPGYDTAGSLGRLLLVDSMGCLIENCALAVAEVSQNTGKIEIYPNPNSGSFTITFNKAGEYHIDIHNALGALVYSNKLLSSKQVIELDERLSAGNYIIQIRGKDLNHTERISIIR